MSPQNNWVPRRDEEGPKVIREIRVKADLAVPGQGKGGLVAAKGHTRCQPPEKKGRTRPGVKTSTKEQEPCSKDSRGDESGPSDLTPVDGDQPHRSNDVPRWFDRSDLNSNREDCLLDGAYHRGQFGISTSAGSERPEITAGVDHQRNRIPHNRNLPDMRGLTLDQENQHRRSEDHIEKFSQIGESSGVDDWRLRKGGGRDHLGRSDSLSESHNWRLTRKNKSSDQESSRYNNRRKKSGHERGHPDRLGNFSKSQNWRDTSTFNSSGREISRFKNWRFKVDHERHQLSRTDQLCNSQNWRVPSNNGRSTQESSWCNNWCFKGDQGRDQQNRSEHLSNSQDLRDARANRRSGPPNARSNCEWRNHQSKTSRRNNRQCNNNALQSVEDTSDSENWHAVKERKQLVQKILNLDSEKWRIRPNCYRSDCKHEKWPSGEYRDRNQSDRSGVKPKGDAREVIKKRLLAKDSKAEMEKVTVENTRTKDLARLLQGETSNQQLSNWIQVSSQWDLSRAVKTLKAHEPCNRCWCV